MIDITEIIKDEINVINEALNNPIPVTLIKTDYGYKGEFTIEGNNYLITIESMVEGGSCFIFKFSMNYSFDLVGDIRKAFSVIPTIKKVVDDFIKEHKPTLFIFTKSDNSRGRERVYNEFSNEVSKKYDYKRTVKQVGDNVLYMLAKNLTEDDYRQTMIYLITRYGEIND